MTPIIIDIKYTAEDYARGALFMARRKWYVRYLYAIPIATMWITYCFAMILASESGRSALSRNLLIVVLVTVFIGIAGYYNSKKRSYRSVRKRFQDQIDSSPAMGEAQELVIDENGISSRQSLGSGQIRWDAIIDVVETEDDFFFFTAKAFAQFIPKYAFQSEEDQQLLRDIVLSRFGDKASLLP